MPPSAALDELVAAHEESPSRWHGAKAVVEALWPWALYAGMTAKMWPYVRGKTLHEAVDLGRLGIVWTDGPKSVWVWEP